MTNHITIESHRVRISRLFLVSQLFIVGFLLATNACPPLWLSVAYVFSLHDWLRGVAYFLVFFAATTVYLVPLLFVGGLGRWPEFRRVARLAAFAVGVLFFVHGILKW